MIRRIVAILASLVMLFGFVVIVVNEAPPAKATIITVDDSGGANYLTIQEGIDAANPGDTVFVYNGTYYENVQVYKIINLTGENRETTIIDGGGVGDVIHVNVSWVNVSGITATNGGDILYDSGIDLNNVRNCKIVRTNISYSYYGLLLNFSSNNTISDNSIHSNYWHGMSSRSSLNNTISNNSIYSHNYYGITLTSKSHNNTIFNNSITSNNIGITIGTSSNNTIFNNSIHSNDHDGILLGVRSNNNTLSSNKIYLNKNDGIRFRQDSNNNTISDNDIYSNDCNGIEFWKSSSCSNHNTISNNSIHSNSNRGIYFDSGSYNTILNNSIYSNDWDGITIYKDSVHNTISDNIIHSNVWEGITLASSNTTLSNNTFINNGIVVGGILLENWITHVIDTLNTVNGKPVYYWKNKTTGTVPFGAGQVILINCTGITVEGQNLSMGSIGIELAFSSNNTLSNNTIYSNSNNGIYITRGSHSNTVSNNSIYSNDREGILIGWGSNKTTISNNSIYSNNPYGIHISQSSGTTISNNSIFDNDRGIEQYYSKTSTITNNSIFSHNDEGIYLYGNSNDNIISENSVFSNANHGLYIVDSKGNTISHNNIHSNNADGINIWSDNTVIKFNNIASNTGYGVNINTLNNVIHHNNFIDNTNQAFDGGFNNSWDNNYPSGGNYWSDFDEPDEGAYDDYSGPNQDIIGQDGKVDKGLGAGGGKNPYITGNGQDNYPMINPIGTVIFLHQGFNLISAPTIEPNSEINTVLNSIEGAYDSVQWYNVNDKSDNWKHHHISKPAQMNDLMDINHTMGFWIHITEPGGALLKYSGSQPTSNQSITLHPGWNMVGYPSLFNRMRDNALNNINFGCDVDAVWTFDAATQTWQEVGPSDNFELGRGYWIHSKVTKVWDVPL